MPPRSGALNRFKQVSVVLAGGIQVVADDVCRHSEDLGKSAGFANYVTENVR